MRCVDVLQSRIVEQKRNKIEQVNGEGNLFAMGDGEGAHFPREMGGRDSDRGGSDKAPFVTEIADVLSSVLSVMRALDAVIFTGHYAL